MQRVRQRLMLRAMLAANRDMLVKITELYALSLIEQDLAWLLLHGFMTLASGSLLPRHTSAKIAELALQAIHIADGFGIPEEMLYAPIALDWERFNETDNRGELLKFNSKL